MRLFFGISMISATTSSRSFVTASAILTNVKWIYEIIPGLKSTEQAIAELQHITPSASVSVTCSPTKGLGATLELSERLQLVGTGIGGKLYAKDNIPPTLSERVGFGTVGFGTADDTVVNSGGNRNAIAREIIPHLSARLVRSPAHTKEIAEWVKRLGIRKVFIVGGDISMGEAAHYPDSLSFMKDFLTEMDYSGSGSRSTLDSVGFAAYPSGHPLASAEETWAALIAKQDLLAEAGITGVAHTQMCLDASEVAAWLKDARARGFRCPVMVGVPGAVSAASLLKIATNLGVGASLRFLAGHRSTLLQLQWGHEIGPLRGRQSGGQSQFVASLARDAERLRIVGFHCFTFNAVADTAAWQRALLEGTEGKIDRGGGE